MRAVRLRSDGLQLVCQVYVPRGDKAFPVLCVCHGIPGAPHNPQDKGYAALAQEFCRAGFLTVIFNFRGTGESQGNL
ncbi:MAG: dienelactone hydrolase, partial [Dehalococcoidia bacterium]|nr:dienelactone hydrolase [Dehalococcoidia bacterium]